MCVYNYVDESPLLTMQNNKKKSCVKDGKQTSNICLSASHVKPWQQKHIQTGWIASSEAVESIFKKVLEWFLNKYLVQGSLSSKKNVINAENNRLFQKVFTLIMYLSKYILYIKCIEARMMKTLRM